MCVICNDMQNDLTVGFTFGHDVNEYARYGSAHPLLQSYLSRR